MDRYQRDTSNTHTLLVYSGGNLTNVPGTLAAKVYDSASTQVATPSITNSATGTYDITISASVAAQMDTYEVVWTETGGNSAIYRTHFEVTGGFIFTVAELIAFDSALSTYSAATIAAAREAVEERMELLMHVGLRPHARRYVTNGDGSTCLLVPDVELTKLVSASINDGTTTTALTADELADVAVHPRGLLERKTLGAWTAGIRNVTVFYEYGFTQAPEPVRRAAMAYAREILVGKALFARATSETTDVGVLRFSLAGRDGSLTGIPEVDAVIAQYGRLIFAV